jgi:hypothetical protein
MAKKETITEIREKPGMSNAGKYKNVKAKDFCGPNGTYPVNTLKRAKAALSYSKFASDPGDIVSCVNKKYPELAKKESDDKKKKAPLAYGSGPLFKKPPKYKKGDLIDETDHEEGKYTTTNKKRPGNQYNVENISAIKEDDKGQYMVSLDEDEFGDSGKKKRVTNYDQGPNAVRDTLRPAKGKVFRKITKNKYNNKPKA